MSPDLIALTGVMAPVTVVLFGSYYEYLLKLKKGSPSKQK